MHCKTVREFRYATRKYRQDLPETCRAIVHCMHASVKLEMSDTVYHYCIIAENFSSVYHSKKILWTLNWTKSEVWTRLVFAQMVTYHFSLVFWGPSSFEALGTCLVCPSLRQPLSTLICGAHGFSTWYTRTIDWKFTMVSPIGFNCSSLTFNEM